MKSLSEILVTMPKRAERKPDDYLVKSFVHVGSVFALFSCLENQIIYGRRGTGKTHLLKYLKNDVQSQGGITLELDMRTMGSTGGMYSDSQLSLSERASRLLSDTLCEIREQILDTCYEYDQCDLSELAPLLDCFVEEATNMSVDGQFEREVNKRNSFASETSHNLTASIAKQANLSVRRQNLKKESDSDSLTTKETGRKILRMHFGSLAKMLKRIVQKLPQNRLLILIDEWSEVPLELQPYLADMLRRIVFAIPTITVKIAAIPHRSNFRICSANGGFIGLEITSDASTSINLDQFMVFDSDSDKSVNFFKNLIYKHVKAADKGNIVPDEIESFISQIFTNKPALEEFVRASEGVPRDAIHIISQASLNQNGQKIGVKTIRNAARYWYTTSKSKDINSRKEAVQLLEWIVNIVIGHKKTRAFLVQSDVNDNLIDFLFDSRVIHLIKQGVSVKSIQSQKFNLYSLDYGCYAHLINTKEEPKGLLCDDANYILVPKIDNIYNRSSILDLERYYNAGLLPLVEHTDEIVLPRQFYSENTTILDFDDEIFNSFPRYLEAQKIKGTVFIPIIFAGLIIRKKQRQKWSSGSEITHSINTYIVSHKDNAKIPNNISRALRSELLLSEGWLVRNSTWDSPVFSLSDNWEEHWVYYFKCPPPQL
ncbi:hypothetical protein FM037_26595 [Shewanella psychropiezotolerans]|uniref:AAA+ ATPase domain-containing protein n=1 Tax=Shewanella psychropiezotolerans TaxID=2593655 RepID=A0ABX5X5G8_9GAMM|nr:hypothetical protein [Shewanella psychropiezotolerans]QDO86178.1 hypothetical protein FM037_26595 [Shewanella psychropiezotolerans]